MSWVHVIPQYLGVTAHVSEGNNSIFLKIKSVGMLSHSITQRAKYQDLLQDSGSIFQAFPTPQNAVILILKKADGLFSEHML